MDESAFISSIECRFPYSDVAKARELTLRACQISPNAVFAVIDEITRPPLGEVVPAFLSDTILSLIEERLSHPLSRPVIAMARRIASGDNISVSDSVALLRKIESYPGQYVALSIAYFASDDAEGVANAEYDRISAKWSAA